MRKFATEAITVNFSRPELAYISSLVDVTFSYSPQAVLTLSIDTLPQSLGFDGYTTWWNNAAGLTYWAEMHILPAFASQTYLFLHELGHALGLDHHGHTLDDTLMVEGAEVNARYTAEEVSARTRYTPGDILDLQARYGTADGVTQVWGDARPNTILGGQGEADPVDGNEILHGGAGNDLIYGNGGNDTIAGDAGADTIYAGAGVDVIYADRFDTLLGLEQHDMVFWV